MSKANRWLYFQVIQGDYGYGWEDLSAGTPAEVRENLRAYQANEFQYGGVYRVVNRREVNPDYPNG